MKTIYSSNYLEIKFCNESSTFYQKWLSLYGINIVIFRKEMLEYTAYYKKYKPSNTIWDQTSFGIELSPEDYEWIEHNVNIPCKEYGNKKCAFVVGQDVIKHVKVMDSFDEVISCIQPKHFGTIKDAEVWIEDETDSLTESDIEVTFDGKNELGKNCFTISTDSSIVTDVLKNVKNMQSEIEFFKLNHSKFLSLTKREVELLKLYGEGNTIKEIHELLFISELTARTHWRNMKRKLEVNSTAEILKFYRTFVK